VEKGSHENNQVILKGRVVDDPTYSHSLYGERFFNLMLEVPRLSGVADVLPVMASDRLLHLMNVSAGDEIAVFGQLRSYNRLQEGRNRLILTVFARHIAPPEDVPDNPNQVLLEGYVCRPPVYRTTPFGREITDLLIAVNRPYNKSDYIPVISWGRNARYAETLEVGQKVFIHGRMQSRQYQKKLPDGTVEDRTAFEVSVSFIEMPEVLPY
jgi:single-stranded DNA-binding protein